MSVKVAGRLEASLIVFLGRVIMNVFHIYLMGKIHLVSLIFAVSCFLYGVIVQRGHIVYRVRNSVAMLAFSHLVFEDFFIMVCRDVGVLTDHNTGNMLKLYLACTIFVLACLAFFNSKTRFLRFEYRNLMGFLAISGVMVWSLIVMYHTGWFEGLQGFMDGTVDPHNLLWAVSKLAGLSFMLPLYHRL